MRVSRFTLALGLALGTSFLVSAALAADKAAGPTPPAQVAKLPTDAPTTEAAPKATAPAPKPEGKQLAQLTPISSETLSAGEMVSLAYEYAWHEDYKAECAWLEATAAKLASVDTARAMVHLAEARGYGGDIEGALALLEQVRDEYRDAELLAFADLVQALVQKEPSWVGHGQRFYAGKDACLALYADAAENWKGTYLGGWASLRLAGMYRSRFAQPEQAVAILDQIAKDYVGTPFAEYALEDAAAAVTFGLHQFRKGRVRYERLLATTESDFVRQRATLHFGELVMDTKRYSEAHELFQTFIDRWPQHVDSSGVRMLRGYVGMRIGLIEEAIADAQDYLFRTSALNPAYSAKAHLVLGRAADMQGRPDVAEAELLLVDDGFLTAEARSDIGYIRAARGDLAGSFAAFMDAAALSKHPLRTPQYLYQAALLARKIEDKQSCDQILDRMIAEFPTSHYTYLLAGRNVAPSPDI